MYTQLNLSLAIWHDYNTLNIHPEISDNLSSLDLPVFSTLITLNKNIKDFNNIHLVLNDLVLLDPVSMILRDLDLLDPVHDPVHVIISLCDHIIA